MLDSPMGKYNHVMLLHRKANTSIIVIIQQCSRISMIKIDFLTFHESKTLEIYTKELSHKKRKKTKKKKEKGMKSSVCH